MISLIYETDAWHTHSSKELIGIALDKDPVELIEEYIKENDMDNLLSDDYDLLQRIKQTQGYSGLGEFIIEERETDELT